MISDIGPEARDLGGAQGIMGSMVSIHLRKSPPGTVDKNWSCLSENKLDPCGRAAVPYTSDGFTRYQYVVSVCLSQY
jgi:hypothetical protein